MIRPATPADAPALLGLQSHLPEPSPELLDAAVGEDPSVAEALVSTTGDGDRSVGYLLAVPGDGTAYVAELVVAPAHRREGRATALLSAFATAADGAITVTVAPDNEAAQSLYRDRGFERVRQLRNFFENGDAVLYRRD